MSITTITAVNLMESDGSGFESDLAKLWFRADLKNQTILETAFLPIFNKWNDLADSEAVWNLQHA
jgi:hypothetical protein